MVLSSVSLKNFRSHLDSSLNFSNGLNYIIGGNGQGKTTILEAIYYLCTTKSNISRSDSEAVNFEKDIFQLIGTFKDITIDNAKIVYSSVENRKYYYLNEKIINKNADVIGKFPVVILSPADHAITQGPPSERRKLVDSIISQSSSSYLYNLIDYNKTLRHRASLLNKIRERRSTSDNKELDSWTEKLISAGVDIILQRVKFTDQYNNYLRKSYYQIMGSQEKPSIRYRYLEDSSEENIKVRFEHLLENKRQEEIRRGTNLAGPHRDDFIFEINNFNIKTFGSQGQNKTFQTALRFAEFFYLKDVSNKIPLFLLDDVFGELDMFRAVKISEYLRKVGQAFITLTDFANFSFLAKEENDSTIKISNNRISYE